MFSANFKPSSRAKGSRNYMPSPYFDMSYQKTAVTLRSPPSVR